MFKDINELLEKIPIWKRLIQLPDRIDEIEKRIKTIEDKISGSGELCPYCQQPAGKLLEIKPHPVTGDLGVNVYYYECTNCHKKFDRQDDEP